jgi:hypothetical protein
MIASGETVWDFLTLSRYFDVRADANVRDLTALLRVMVLKGAPPASFAALLRPEHARVVEEGARLMAALPTYLARRRALFDVHCRLFPPLRAMVRGYDSEPTTTSELWATGLGAAPQRVRWPRPEVAVELPVPRSARVRQRLE